MLIRQGFKSYKEYGPYCMVKLNCENTGVLYYKTEKCVYERGTRDKNYYKTKKLYYKTFFVLY